MQNRMARLLFEGNTSTLKQVEALPLLTGWEKYPRTERETGRVEREVCTAVACARRRESSLSRVR